MAAFTPDERKLLAESIDDYFAKRYGAQHAREVTRSDDADGFDRAAWAEYAALGWLGLMLPEDVGGSAGGLTEGAILFAGAAQHLAAEPLIPTLVQGAGALALGTPAQSERLAEIGAGRHIMALCHGEPASGYDRAYVEAVATPQNGGYRIDGAKSFALGAHVADTLVVSARLGVGGPVALFLVPGNADGLTKTASPTIDGRRGAAVTLSGVAVPAAALLGESDADRLGAIDALLDRAVLAYCADSIGAMTAAAGTTTEYLKQRQQFGQPLTKFQVVQHRLADMHILCEETRAMVHAALADIDADRPGATQQLWRAKVQTARASRFVGAQGVQLHGGMGMTDEMSAGHYYKRLSVNEAMYGDHDWQLARLSTAARATPADRAA